MKLSVLKSRKHLGLLKTLTSAPFKKALDSPRPPSITLIKPVSTRSASQTTCLRKLENQQVLRFTEICRTYLSPDTLALLSNKKPKSSRQGTSPSDYITALNSNELNQQYAALLIEWKQLKLEFNKLQKARVHVRTPGVSTRLLRAMADFHKNIHELVKN